MEGKGLTNKELKIIRSFDLYFEKIKLIDRESEPEPSEPEPPEMDPIEQNKFRELSITIMKDMFKAKMEHIAKMDKIRMEIWPELYRVTKDGQIEFKKPTK